MGDYSQYAVDCQMQHNVGDYGDYDGQQQRMSLIRAWTCHNSSKRNVERICNRHDKLNKSGSAARGEQRQQETDSQERVKQIKQIIDYL